MLPKYQSNPSAPINNPYSPSDSPNSTITTTINNNNNNNHTTTNNPNFNDPFLLVQCSKLIGKSKLFRRKHRLFWIAVMVVCYSTFWILIYAYHLHANGDEYYYDGGGSTPFFQKYFWMQDIKDQSAACLLVMDDNHFLIEWLAFHYYTMNLKHVILVADPNSQTTPRPILDRWNYLMNIQQWNDNDYMTPEEFQQARQDVMDYFGASSGNGISKRLVNHRARQRMFYYKCLQHYKQQNINTWVMLWDTDEFVRLNYKTIESVPINATTKLPPALSMDRPGSTIKFLRQSIDFTDTIPEEKANANQPLYILQSSPCIQIPRIRFGGQDSNTITTTTTITATHNETISSLESFLQQQQEQQSNDNSYYYNNNNKDNDKITFNASHFLTLRHTTHAAPHDYTKNKISKTLIDLSRVAMEDILPVDSIHMPIRSICQQRRLHLRTFQSLLVLHHYLGTEQQYTYRQRDARSGNMGTNERSAIHWNMAQDFTNPQNDDAIQPWINGFLKTTKKSSSSLLSKEVSLLQNVGQLEPTSWYTFHGDPTQERCALLFFGLPRAYRNMVLPSIVRNLLIPNARHNCDVYVHFYEQYEEIAGRKNRGGSVDPREIFLLQHAVKAVQHKYGPSIKYGGRNANREPIVAFTHDTEQEFWTKRGYQLHKYHTTMGPDGHPAYFPWRAKTYTNTSLDNMVKQWHSIEYAFKLMNINAKQQGVNYTRVGMFRSDAMYMTPIDIAMLDKGVIDTFNHYVVVAPFARMPVNDRMIYGSYEAVKVWATERFDRVEDRVKARLDPGYEMHSEHFLNATIFPAIEALGYGINMNRDICFVRTRADESAMVTDCNVNGVTRGWENLNKKRLVEEIVQKNCTKYKMGFKWTFVGCGEGIEYRST